MVKLYVRRIQNLRQMRNYLGSDRYMSRPYNNKVAKINN